MSLETVMDEKTETTDRTTPAAHRYIEEAERTPQQYLAAAEAALMRAGAEPRFVKVLMKMARTAMDKGHDYSPGKDPYANAKSSEQFGVPAWKGIAIRLGDKMQRLRSLSLNGTLKNEAVEDTALDVAVYGAILLIVLEEGH